MHSPNISMNFAHRMKKGRENDDKRYAFNMDYPRCGYCGFHDLRPGIHQ